MYKVGNSCIVEYEEQIGDYYLVGVFYNSGHRCGYVGVKKDNILFGKDYYNNEFGDDKIQEEVNFIDTHGGLTYAGQNLAISNLDKYKDIWFFGFDCNHYGDIGDYEKALELFGDEDEELKQELQTMIKAIQDFPTPGTVKDLNFVKEEIKYIYEQWKEIEENHNSETI